MKREALQLLTFDNQGPEKMERIVTCFAKIIRKRVCTQKRGRPHVDLRYVLGGIMYYTRNNCGWAHVPAIFGNWRTIYGWFRRLARTKQFFLIWVKILALLQQIGRTRFKRIKVDGSLVQACGGGKLAVSTPRNHNKRSLNRGVMVDGRGLPIALHIIPGNAHDSQFFAPLFAKTIAATHLKSGFYMHGDKGFDALWIRLMISRLGGHAQIPVRNHGFTIPYHQGKDSFRWQIEQFHAWTNQYRALKVMTSRCSECIYALHQLVFAVMCSRKLTCHEAKRLSMCGLSDF